MKITNKKGDLKLSLRKIINMAIIVLFFDGVARRWERKRRREFKRAVKYKGFSIEKINTVLADFDVLTSCNDPYIENFYIKHPEFSTLHKLWVLNSAAYWTGKLKAQLAERV